MSFHHPNLYTPSWRFRPVPAWVPIALLSVMTLRAPAQAQPRQVAPSDVGTAAATSDVARAVLRRLQNDPHLEASGLFVRERNGIVELGGSVPVPAWRARAARIASTVQTVRAVVNRIGVTAVRRPDETVAKDVRRALRATAALAKMPITVQVADGVVELSGVISTWEQQQLAERVANGVPGVRFCQNQLTSSNRMKRTSAMIAADIRSRLDWDPFVQRAPVEVTVSNRRVALKGVVGGAIELRRVIAHAWVKGVISVAAQDVVVDAVKRPDRDLRLQFPTDAEIAVALGELTPFWPSVGAAKVSTSVAAGIVTLRGTVQTLAEKRAAEEMARSAVGVVGVDTDLRGPWWRPPVVVAPRPAAPRPKRAARGR